MDCAPRGLTKGVTTAAAAAAGAKGGAFVSKDCCDMVSGTAAAAAAGLEGGSLAVPLQVAAAAVRSSLTDLRSAERAGSELLKLVTQQQAAPKRVLVSIQAAAGPHRTLLPGCTLFVTSFTTRAFAYTRDDSL